MTLNEIFDHLTYGELSQLSLTKDLDGSEGISEEDRYKLVSHINMGLTVLHERFFLREGRQTVYVSPGVRSYTVNADDILKIEKVLNAAGDEIPINYGDEAKGIHTTSYNSFLVGSEVEIGSELTVIYRANHPALTRRDSEREPHRVVVHLPRTHIEALIYFIASRVTNPVGFAIEGMHEGNNYYAKFERACQVIENGGYKITQQEEKPRIQRMGWV